MAKEIEHKYLVTSQAFIKMAASQLEISQGYLSTDKERTVRVRTLNENAFITIKGANCGDTRDEFEYQIPKKDAIEMLNKMCIPYIIQKTRYNVPFAGNNWEIDVFHGRLEGLVIAEIEISDSEYKYQLPPFIGKEVTDDIQYYNSNLSKR